MTARMQGMKGAWLPGLLALMLLSFAGCDKAAEAGGVRHLDTSAFQQQMQATPGAILLDVRTPGEFSQGHLPQSTLLPVQVLESKAAQALPDKSAPIFVYCRTGQRSAVATQMLQSMGYTNVVNMLGGIVKWAGEGKPLTR